MTYSDILNMSPTQLFEWITKEFIIQIPAQIHSIEDMDYAATTLLKLSSHYSYLNSLLSYAKIRTRECKRSGDRIEYEDMVDKKEIIQNMTDSVKQQYAAVSRSVTIRIENNQELRMNANGYIKG